MRPFERPSSPRRRRGSPGRHAAPARPRRGAHVPRRQGRGGRVPHPPPARASRHPRPPRQAPRHRHQRLARRGRSGGRTVKRFAADITGKRPESFEAITGTREVPTPHASPAPRMADLARLASTSTASTRPSTRPPCATKLAPLSRRTSRRRHENEVLAALHAALKNKPWVNQLVKEGRWPRCRAQRPRRARLPRATPTRAAPSRRCSRSAPSPATSRRAGPRAHARPRPLPRPARALRLRQPSLHRTPERARRARLLGKLFTTPPRLLRRLRLPRLRDRLVPQLRQPLHARLLSARVARSPHLPLGRDRRRPLSHRAPAERAALHRAHRGSCGPPQHWLPRHR
jgi:hypothetical protein